MSHENPGLMSIEEWTEDVMTNTQIISKRSVTEDFVPLWEFSGIVCFDGSLEGDNRKHAEEIVTVLSKLLKE